MRWYLLSPLILLTILASITPSLQYLEVQVQQLKTEVCELEDFCHWLSQVKASVPRLLKQGSPDLTSPPPENCTYVIPLVRDLHEILYLYYEEE